jgi:hypothetical protein
MIIAKNGDKNAFCDSYKRKKRVGDSRGLTQKGVEFDPFKGTSQNISANTAPNLSAPPWSYWTARFLLRSHLRQANYQ